MQLHEAQALRQTTALRLDRLRANLQIHEKSLADLLAQGEVLAALEPCAATARRKSDWRTRKHAQEARVAETREAADTTARELRRLDEALAAHARRQAAPPPIARPVGTGSSALRPVVTPAPLATPVPVPPSLPLPPVGRWQQALLPTDGHGYGGKIGPYRIERLLGTGSQAAVYLASDAIRQAALKVIDAAQVNQDTWKAVRREARRLASIRDDHVLTAYGFDEVEFQPDPACSPYRLAYLALEYMEHGNLIDAEKAAGGRLPTATALDAVIQAATGLAAIHSAGVLHRDLKPHNIMVGVRDGNPVYRLGDLGIATETDLAAHDLSGTLHYLAPEILLAHQAKNGPLPFAHSSDVFGLGATLYRLVTGASPIQALAARRGTASGTVHAATLYAEAKTLPDPRALNGDCPRPLAEAILAATAFDPAARPASAEDLAERLAESSTKRRFLPW